MHKLKDNVVELRENFEPYNLIINPTFSARSHETMTTVETPSSRSAVLLSTLRIFSN